MRELEREKDCLWAGLEVLEQAQCWYHTVLQTRNHALVGTRTRRSGLADQDIKVGGDRDWVRTGSRSPLTFAAEETCHFLFPGLDFLSGEVLHAAAERLPGKPDE